MGEEREAPATQSGRTVRPAQLLRELEDMVVGLRRGARDLSFYPPNHPALKRSLERCLAQVKSLAELEAPLTLSVAREGLAHRLGAVGKENAQVRQVASDLYLRRIQEVLIVAAVGLEDLRGFLQLLNLDPKEVWQAGGAEKVLADRNVGHITVREAAFRIQEGEAGKAATEAVQLQEAEGVATDPQAAAVELDWTATDAGVSAGALAEGEAQPVEAGGATAEAVALTAKVAEELPEDVGELLALLEAAPVVADYRRVAEKLAVKGREAAAGEKAEDFLQILTAFILHLHPNSPKDGPTREAAEEMVRLLADPAGMAYLAGLLCQKDAPQEDDIIFLLMSLGDRSVEPLINRLSAEKGQTARRRLMEAVVQVGPKAVPTLLQYVVGQPWFVTRNVIGVLGRIGDPRALELVGRSAQHEDARVRREAVRALAHLSGPRASLYIMGGLRDQDPGVRLQAIAALGTLRDRQAIPALAPLAAAAGRRGDPEARKAALGALGLIGGPVALRTLRECLTRRSWFFRRADDEVKVAAAQALATMGTREALGALEAVATSGPQRLRQICAHALEQRGRGEAAGRGDDDLG